MRTRCSGRFVAVVVVGLIALASPGQAAPFGTAVHPSGSHVYIGNANANSVSVIETATRTVVGNVTVGLQSAGLAQHPDGTRAFVVDTKTHTITSRIPVADGPAAFGFFIAPAPCDSTALEQALAATQAQASALQTTNQALGAENGRLQSDLAAVRATIVSFVRMRFGERVDENVAGTVRAVALAELTAARAVAPRSWRVQHAQGSFDQGDNAMRGHDWRRAVREYREAGAIVERIRGERHRTAEAPASVVREPAPAAPPTLPSTTGACDTTPLEQGVAATERQIGSLQAASQALTTNNARLRAELAAARAGITSFVRRLFGEGTDANVAAAARDASLAELTAAHEAASHDRRLRLAQHSFDHGQHAMRKHDWGRAVHEFRERHELCERILRDKARSPARPVTSD